MSGQVVPARCTNCRTELDSPIVCAGCRSLFPLPGNVDYFALMGLDRCFSIEEEKMASAFRAVSSQIHPDRFCGQADEVKQLATRLSADLNNAMITLKDPLRRAAYLLHLAGGPDASQERGVAPEVLGEVMELREEIDDALSSNDSAKLDSLRSTVSAHCEQLMGEVAKMADNLESSSDEEKQNLRLLINAVKYYEGLSGKLTADPFSHMQG